MTRVPPPPQLTEDQINTALPDLTGWTFSDGKLQKEFEFSSFASAFAFMTQIAIEAEKNNHHPTWLNMQQIVRVNLTTHESGGVTARDIKLAKLMNRVAGM